VTPLQRLVADELAVPVPPQVAQLAAAVAARHAAAARSVLFYGSCLRAASLDGLMLDFYLIVSDYDAAFDRRWLARANRLLPPNVFAIAAQGLAAKYAVLSEADFARLSGPTTSVSVWARFAQPSRLAWVSDDSARQTAIAAVARAAPTLLAATRPVVRDRIDVLALWRCAFALTYAAELRAERRKHAASVVDFDPDRYAAFTIPALAAAGIDAEISDGAITFARAITAAESRAGQRAWLRRRIAGKLLTLARLAKGSATFADGLDYLIWKINRHAGTKIELTPWQRRHPWFGVLTLLPRLLARGAVR
jgi:hypothetical protein